MKQDTITLQPSTISGHIEIPTSKSLAHRAILAAALANGTSIVTDVSMSEDILATIGAMQALGASITVDGSTVTVKGMKGYTAKETTIDCNESGSTIRFLIPILSLFKEEFTVTGKKSLIARPQSVYEDIFQNDVFERSKTTITFQGKLKAKEFQIPGDISSQFVTGLLFVLPLLEGNSKITFTSPLQSKDYVKLTLDVLKEFGILVTESDDGYLIEGNQRYHSANYRVEGDYSQAAFWLVNGAINDVTHLTNMNPNSHQGDRKVVDLMKKIGVQIDDADELVVSPSNMNATTIDVSDIPDCGPILAVLASQMNGVTELINVERLRIKESDRVESTVETLKKLGVSIKDEGSKIVVEGPCTLSGNVTVDSYNDHRIAMMVAIAAGIAEEPITLTRATAVNKSYPTFFEDYLNMGGKYSEGENGV